MTTPAAPQRGRVRKAPGDATGREDQRLKAENATAIELAAQQMSMATAARSVEDDDVVDFTDAARPKIEVKPPEPVYRIPQKHKVRVLADIDRMTFGKEIIDPGDFTDPNNPHMPVLGSLKEYSFKEGRVYLVDEPLYQHLKQLEYIYDD